MSNSGDQVFSSSGSSVPSTAPFHEHVFNDDLLMNEGDLKYVKSQFPRIVHVLDHKRLRAKFAEYDEEANTARERMRSLGLSAIVFATLALLTVATQPIWPRLFWTRWLAVLFEVGGMAAALVASGGLWLGPWKRRWLESRLMTERLRQWQFQLLVRRTQDIEASANSPDGIISFEQQRARWLDEFLKSYEGKLDSQVEALTSELGDQETWLHGSTGPYAKTSAVAVEVFDAYEQLRFDHQYRYAVYKLRRADDKPLWQFLKWPAIRQAALLSAMASTGLIAALACSVALIYGDVFGVPTNVEVTARTGAIAAALIGLALRTLHEGLAPEKEIERYNDYRGRVAQLRDRFKRTMDLKERLHLMEELEGASVDELRGFLRTHQHATFLLT